MSNQFIFFCTNLGSEKLLKKEIETFYPELNLSYSRKGFLTFKNLGVQYDFSTISQLSATFATRVGICIGKARPEDLLDVVSQSSNDLAFDLDACEVHSFSVNTDFTINAKEIFNKEVNSYTANGKRVLNLITLGEKEVWFGIHTVTPGITRYPNASIEIDVPTNSPSKAYLKLAQIVQLYAVKFDRNDNWLDFGSSPGGASLYLLNKGCKVWGIDPAKMPDEITDHKNYTHVSTSVQDLAQEGLPDLDIHWVHVDLNLKPTQAIKEVLRLCKKYNFSLKGILFTIQLTNIDYIEDMEDFEDQLYDWGFSAITSVQVPAHKQEYVILARV